jgi:hypothetical protein
MPAISTRYVASYRLTSVAFRGGPFQLARVRSVPATHSRPASPPGLGEPFSVVRSLTPADPLDWWRASQKSHEGIFFSGTRARHLS